MENFQFHPGTITPQDYKNCEVIESRPLKKDELADTMVNESERPFNEDYLKNFQKFTDTISNQLKSK